VIDHEILKHVPYVVLALLKTKFTSYFKKNNNNKQCILHVIYGKWLDVHWKWRM